MEMAGVRTALLLLPPLSVVLLVMAVRKLRGLARAQFVRPPSSGSSSSLRSYLAVEKGELPVALYRRSGGGGGEEEEEEEQEHAAECVFCLSGIEEGSEVRELECRHLFHRGCLDRWLLARPLATCPLCRCRLLAWEEEEYDGEESESESDMMLFMAPLRITMGHGYPAAAFHQAGRLCVCLPMPPDVAGRPSIFRSFRISCCRAAQLSS
ncbi:hypothetical protein C2845_PM03G16890 [Panicum miliaceum]|uniref:RING-type domain-containing protein n=1 Tax=Panicum miliaceum TaxID=4540 RepID=A0A3L6T743_PANMI|nr:hypothetical protein C2845_PM03G16890 [Panicum miliaceum]